MFELTGLRAIVGGSSKGIGRACAEVLARQGASITLLARDAAILRQVCESLPTDASRSHTFLSVDFNEPAAMQEAVATHLDGIGPVDILVNNTGGPPAGALYDAAPADFERALRMHLLCNQLLAQALVPRMKERRFGRIINIISTSVKEPIAGLGVSNTTRWAVASWGKTLSRELAADGITVNNVLPGYTGTEHLFEVLAAIARQQGREPGEIENDAHQGIPAGRFAEPEEIGAAVAFLASKEAGYVNGVNLPIDGGRLGDSVIRVLQVVG